MLNATVARSLFARSQILMGSWELDGTLIKYTGTQNPLPETVVEQQIVRETFLCSHMCPVVRSLS